MNKLSISAITLAAILLAACGKQEAASTAAATEKKEEFSLSREQLVKANSNEWAEIERRCLGSSSSTCQLAKSEGVLKERKLEAAFNKAGGAMDKITGK